MLNYDGRRLLGRILSECLDSVLRTDYGNFEVLFVDNASRDDSVEFVKKTFGEDPRLRIVRNERNLGFAEGNNAGIRQARGEYVVLLNTDTRVEPDWLKNLIDAAEPTEVAAVQSKLLQMNHPDLLDSAGGLLDYYGYHTEVGRGETSSRYNKCRTVFYGKGASILLKRKVLEKTGLFDNDIFLYFDEVDLCWRIWLSGHKVVYAPESIVYHSSGSTTAKMRSKERSYFYSRNHMMVLLKNYNLANAATATAVTVFFEARNIALFLARRRPILSFAILEALLWNLLNLKKTWVKRQVVQSNVRSVSDEEVRKQMLKPFPPFPLYVMRPNSSKYKNPNTN